MMLKRKDVKVTVGKVELIEEDSCKRSKWKRGRIIELLISNDGKV